MAKINLKTLKNRTQKELKQVKNPEEIKQVFNRYLGKKGEVAQVLRSLAKMPKAKRIKVGKQANELKEFIEKELEAKKSIIPNSKFIIQKDFFDITVPGKKPGLGRLHPLTQERRRVEEIFQSMGFFVAQGPDVENEWYNFDALNIPKDHPARDQWDTFWLKPERSTFNVQRSRLLLRTHTSPVQIRYMENHQPPLRIIAPGNAYRHEATDASHEFQLFQIEGLMVDKKISSANFKYIIEEFLRQFFNKKVKIRLRPDFFPFTEPSFDVSINCLVCGGTGCAVCKQAGWVEVAGAGMVHPNVFKNAGLNPKDWQGFAFGFGLERLVMLKYKINDIRLFRSGDLRFLNQF